jgi:hypothetical protein
MAFFGVLNRCAAEITDWSNSNYEVVPGERIELSRPHGHRILNPARLPVPPSRQAKSNVAHYNDIYFVCNLFFKSR